MNNLNHYNEKNMIQELKEKLMYDSYYRQIWKDNLTEVFVHEFYSKHQDSSKLIQKLYNIDINYIATEAAENFLNNLIHNN